MSLLLLLLLLLELSHHKLVYCIVVQRSYYPAV